MQQIYPDWVKKHKSKNVEIRRLKNNFYAYKVKTIWDKKKKRPRKITESYLGKITTDGIIPAKHNREIKINHIKEYGNIKLVKLFSDKIEEILKSYFPYSYQSILVSAMIRLAYKSPLKNQYFHYCNSYLEEYYPEAVVSPNKLSELINKIGCEYGSQLGVFKDLGTGKQHFAMDMTQIFSESENIDWLEFGYNGKEEYHKQLQFLLIYSLDKAEPSFFKLLPGSIRDVSSIVNAIYESRLHNVVLVVDKGFYSEDNAIFLDDSQIGFVMPLRRNLEFLEYYSDDGFTEYFKFRDRFIWFKEYKHGKYRVLLFLDKKLRANEENIFLSLVDKKERELKEYKHKRGSFGTISILTNTELSPNETYLFFKNRGEIECAFDALKNTLESDKTYMRSEESMRGYFFISFISLYLYCKIVEHLRQKELLDAYSVQDVLMHLSKIYKLSIGDKEITSETPKKVRLLIEKLALPIT